MRLTETIKTYLNGKERNEADLNKLYNPRIEEYRAIAYEKI